MSGRRGAKRPNVERECKSSIHHITSLNKSVKRVYSVTSKDFSRKSLKKLQEMGAITDRSRYVCNLCIEHATEQLPPSESNVESQQPSTTEKTDEEHTEKVITLIDELLLELNSREINAAIEDKLSELFRSVGKNVIRPMMLKEANELADLYKTDFLLMQSSRNFLEKCNSILLAFIQSITNRRLNSLNIDKMFHFASVIEHIYHLGNYNLVLPHNFVANLIQTLTSGSKTVTEINAKISPGGSDPTYRSWLKVLGGEKLRTPSGDMDFYIDNIGKYIVKSYRVKSTRNKSPNVITAVLNIPLRSPDGNENLQYQEELKPSNWQNLYIDELQLKMNQLIQSGMPQIYFFYSEARSVYNKLY